MLDQRTQPISSTQENDQNPQRDPTVTNFLEHFRSKGPLIEFAQIGHDDGGKSLDIMTSCESDAEEVHTGLPHVFEGHRIIVLFRTGEDPDIEADLEEI